MAQFSVWWRLLLFYLIPSMGTAQETWPNEVLTWSSDYPPTQLLTAETPQPPKPTPLDAFIKKSNDFPITFPSNVTRCQHLQTKTTPKSLEKIINSAHPLIHEQVLQLIVSFLNQKRRFGSTKEREFYQNVTFLEFVDRLLTKRAVSFVGTDDQYLLLDGTRGRGKWESIGTSDEEPPLVLENCLSYDEIQISALLSLSSESFFIKEGGDIGDVGVVIGAVGPRLDKEAVMEYREIMKTKQQNTHLYGYGQFFVPTMQGIFTNFYGDVSATFDEWQMRKAFEDTVRFVKIDEDRYFDTWVYARRVALSVDCILLEASRRAQEQGTSAYVDMVGLGLRKWRITPEQDHLFVDVVKKRIKFLGQYLYHISHIGFSGVGKESIDDKVLIENHPQGGITLQSGEQRPDSKGKLLVVSYDWNGNSLPGNEYWLHNLTKSLAETTQIAEIHNPLINPNIQAANLKVATVKGIVSLLDYIADIK